MYVKNFNTIGYVCLGVSLVSFFAVVLERGVKLRQELDTDYSLETKAMQNV